MKRRKVSPQTAEFSLQEKQETNLAKQQVSEERDENEDMIFELEL